MASTSHEAECKQRKTNKTYKNKVSETKTGPKITQITLKPARGKKKKTGNIQQSVRQTRKKKNCKEVKKMKSSEIQKGQQQKTEQIYCVCHVEKIRY